MAQVIRITQTKVFEYKPDFESGYYIMHDVKTLAEALVWDKADCDQGNTTLEELGAELVKTIKDDWEVVDVET